MASAGLLRDPSAHTFSEALSSAPISGADTMDCSPTPTASAISRPFVSFCISRRLRRPPIRVLSTPVHGPPLCADTAAPRCSSSRPSLERNTSVDRRSLRGCHEHTLFNSAVFIVGASSSRADANARGHRPRYPTFLHASVANFRLRPHRLYTPWRRGPPIGSAITLAGPSAFVQIAIAHRNR